MAVDFLKDVATALKPPAEGGPTPEYRWRATVAFSIIVGYGIAILIHAAIWGFIPGFSGFAFASDVNNRFQVAMSATADTRNQITAMNRTLNTNANMILATVISGQILNMYANECAAKRSHNIDLAANIDAQTSDLQVKYMAVSGGSLYPLAPCP